MKGRDLLYLIIPVILFMLLILQLNWPMVDDTYIHLQYARNLAEEFELSFNRGDPSYGATSPLWVFILSVVHLAGGDMVVWCRVFSCLFGLLSVGLVYIIALHLSSRRWVGMLAAIIAASEAWLVRWSAVGMETSLTVFMVLMVLWGWGNIRKGGRGSVLFGLLLFLAFVARPELLMLFPLAVLTSLINRSYGGFRRSACWLMVFIPLLAGWFWLIRWHTGNFLPLTAGAKQGAPVLTPDVFRKTVIPLKILASTAALPWLFTAAGLIRGVGRDFSATRFFLSSRTEDKYRPVVILALLWIISLPVLYVLFDFQIISRYLVPVNIVAVALGTVAVYHLNLRLNIAAALKRWIPLLMMLLAVTQNVIFLELVVAGPTRRFSRGLEEVLGGMGKWLNRKTPPGTVVALCDIGVVGYYSRRTILDLGGLINPVINEMRQEMDVEEIIREGLFLRFDPDYFIDRSGEPARFAGKTVGGVRFMEVMRGTVSGLGIRKPGPVFYVLYRLVPVEREGAGEDRAVSGVGIMEGSVRLSGRKARERP